MEKKEWSEPELIVLVRSKLEETVLITCKTSSTAGANSDFGYCALATLPGPAICSDCSAQVAS